MATRTVKTKAATKTAPKRTSAAAKKEESEGRLVGYALMDTRSSEFKQLTERRQAWILRWQDVAPKMKNVHRILEHNKGLFWIFTTDGHYQVGRMSDSGKSFQVEFDTTDRDESYEYYVEHRSGSYGKEKAPAAKPKAKTAKAKTAAPKKAAAKPKRTRKAAPVEFDDELEDMLD